MPFAIRLGDKPSFSKNEGQAYELEKSSEYEIRCIAPM